MFKSVDLNLGSATEQLCGLRQAINVSVPQFLRV